MPSSPQQWFRFSSFDFCASALLIFIFATVAVERMSNRSPAVAREADIVVDVRFLPDDYSDAAQWHADGEVARAERTSLPVRVTAYKARVSELQRRYDTPFDSTKTRLPDASPPKSRTPAPRAVAGPAPLPHQQQKARPADSQKWAPPPGRALPPLPQRKSRGGVIPRIPRRTYIDDLVSPSGAMAATPTPGPAMLPYLEGADAAINASRQAPGSHWHDAVGRARVDKHALWCTPIHAAPEGAAKKVPGGRIPNAKRPIG